MWRRCIDGEARALVVRYEGNFVLSTPMSSLVHNVGSNREEVVMLQNIIWGAFIAIPLLFAVAAIVAYVRTNRELDIEE